MRFVRIIACKLVFDTVMGALYTQSILSSSVQAATQSPPRKTPSFHPLEMSLLREYLSCIHTRAHCCRLWVWRLWAPFFDWFSRKNKYIPVCMFGTRVLCASCSCGFRVRCESFDGISQFHLHPVCLAKVCKMQFAIWYFATYRLFLGEHVYAVKRGNVEMCDWTQCSIVAFSEHCPVSTTSVYENCSETSQHACPRSHHHHHHRWPPPRRCVRRGFVTSTRLVNDTH